MLVLTFSYSQISGCTPEILVEFKSYYFYDRDFEGEVGPLVKNVINNIIADDERVVEQHLTAIGQIVCCLKFAEWLMFCPYY